MSVEGKRLQLLDQTQLMDTAAEGRFDRITRITRRLLSVPIAGISLIGRDRRWFKSLTGTVGLTETERRGSLCDHALDHGEVLVVQDTTADTRFVKSPMVCEYPFIRFYAGISLSFQGEKIGVLSVMDTEPRNFSPEESRDLMELALWVEGEFETSRLNRAQVVLKSEARELKRQALLDDLTGTWNRVGIQQIFVRECAQAIREETNIALVMADIDHFKQVNDKHGHRAGDFVLRSVSERIRLAVRPYDSVGRVGGEEFLLIFPNTSLEAAAQVAERIRLAVSIPENIHGVGLLTVTLSQGVAAAGFSRANAPEFESLRGLADKALYIAKARGRNRVEVSGKQGVTEP